MSYEIINSDCLKAMQEMPDGCIDAIVTDPPYGLSFMGKEWDSFGTDTRQPGDEHYWVPDNPYGRAGVRYGWNQDKSKLAKSNKAFQERMTPIFKEALRVAKPGAHMLCFGGTRTFHRLACSLEDAGWEIRDTIMWVYGSGFPKSMDVGKAIDKAFGAERERGGKKVYAGGHVQNSHESIGYGGSDPTQDQRVETLPATDQGKEWDGWGTCLKPAWEPIIVARKPLDGTVAHNVMEHGTGAINIDGCRVPTWDNVSTHSASKLSQDSQLLYGTYGEKETHQTSGQKLGRFPANLVHDGSQEVLGLFPEVARSTKCRQARTPRKTDVYGLYSMEKEASPMVGYDDGGTAARFFYCAKASKRDRGEGNDHPTVKPNALMRWLVRLVCPQGGTVLDPFTGSGSTGVACMQEGMRFIGIDMDQHYCEIAERRIDSELDVAFDEV